MSRATLEEKKRQMLTLYPLSLIDKADGVVIVVVMLAVPRKRRGSKVV